MYRQHEVLSTPHAAECEKVLSTKITRYQETKQAKRENFCDPQQTLITNFYKLTTNIGVELQRLSSENQYLKSILCDNRVCVNKSNIQSENEKYNFKSTTEFLNKIWKVIETKSNTKHGHIKEYDQQLKQFATYLYIIAGQLTYETLCSNLSLPSVATIKKEIQSSNETIVEGEVRVDSLKSFLIKRDLCPQVWLSEDATKIVNKIEYDSTTDQIVGLVLPINSDGNPVTFSFVAENVEKMNQSLLNYPKSDYAYSVMSRSLDVNAPSFCLQLFGTDNKFTTGQVLRRWTYTERALESKEIKILGWSSDGDTRCLRAMLIRSGLPCLSSNVPSKWQEWFNAYFQPELMCVQDTHHICSKSRNRLYDNTAVIVLGNYIASKSHLHILIETMTKDKHLLVPSDLRPLDKMNFRPVLKIMNPIVRTHLKEQVAASLGTSIYLSLMQNVYSSYLDENFEPLERVYSLWYVIFFLRIWRLWLTEHKTLSLKNFITYNTYACIEINGHSLINTIIKLRNSGEDNQFVTVLMGSQTCEEFFRSLRSLSSTQWTSINFTLLEMLHKIKRIEYTNEAMADLSSTFTFPRLSTKVSKNHKLPSDDEIYDTVMRAKDDAIKETKSIGMLIKRNERNKSKKQTEEKSIFCCRLSNIRLKPNERYLEDEDEDDECFEDEHDYPSDVSEDEYDSDEEPDNLNQPNQQQHEMEKEAEKIQEDISSILKAHGGSINIKEFHNVKRNAKKIS